MRSPTRALLHLLSLPRPHTPVHARLRAHKLTPPGQVGVRADFSSKAGAFIAKATQPIEAGTELLFWYGNMCYERWINSKPEEPHPALAPHHSIAPLSTLWSEWSALRPPPAPRAAHRVVWACDPRICDPCIYMRPIYVRPMRATHAYVTQPTSRSPRGMGTGPSLTLHTPVSSHARLFTRPSLHTPVALVAVYGFAPAGHGSTPCSNRKKTMRNRSLARSHPARATGR